MDSSEIIARVEKAVPDATEVLVEGADCSFTTVVVSPSFDGQSLLKRQQAVLSHFVDLLGSGDLHALTVKAHTPAEWSAKQQPKPQTNLTQLSI